VKKDTENLQFVGGVVPLEVIAHTLKDGQFILVYRVNQSSRTVLKEVAEEIIWSRNVENVFSDSPLFRNGDVFTLMSPCIIVIV
jgi:hypothetical protein